MVDVQSILSSEPYNAPFDPAKNHLQVLFKPRVTVQTRELNELQTIFRNQMASFSNSVYTNGSVVSNGRVVKKTVHWFRLLPQHEGVNVDVSQWLDKNIYTIDDLGNAEPAKGYVTAVAAKTVSDPPTIYVEFLAETVNGGFLPGKRIRVDGSGLTATLEADPDTYHGTAISAGVAAGIYFIEGNFVAIPSTQIIAKKYDPKPTGSFGLEYEFYTVNSDDDPELLDKSRSSPNWSAKGADRLTVKTTPRFLDPSVDTIPSNFINVLTLEEGETKVIKKVPVYSDLAAELARRTWDESGDYTVGSPFKMTTDNDYGVKIKSITHSGPALAHVAEVLSAIPHGLTVGTSIRIAGATGGDAAVYNGVFTVESVTDEYRFKYNLAAVPAADAVGDPLEVTSLDHFAAVLSPGKAYVRGYEIETVANTVVQVARARATSIVNNYSTSVSYGSYIDCKVTTGSRTFPSLQTATANLKETGGATIGTCRIKAVQLLSGLPTSTTGVWRVFIYDVRITNASYNFEKARTIIAATGESMDILLTDGKAIVAGVGQGTPLLRVPQNYVKTVSPGGLNDTSVIYYKQFTGTTSGPNTVSFSLTGNERFVGPVGVNFAGSSLYRRYYYTTGSTATPNIEPTSAIIAAGQQQITLTFATSHTVNLTAAIQGIEVQPKTKTPTNGTLNLTYVSSQKSYSLGFADVFRIISIKVGTYDVTQYFTLDTGQRDEFYDHSSIVANTTPIPGVDDSQVLTVQFTRFAHTGSSYFSADSYSSIDYSLIPTYTSVSTGEKFRLADCLDFRPVRDPSATTHSNALRLSPGESINADIEFYLPRRDRIVLTKQGEFKDILGTPALKPVLPAAPAESMTLYELSINAYTIDAVMDVSSKYIDNRNYTMRDIGRIDRRVDRLEYQTALSMLEMHTNAADVIDQNGLDRFKNGFLVDAFTGHRTGDVYSPDYRCSIDPTMRELRPAFVPGNVGLEYSAVSSSLVNQKGDSENGFVLTLPYTSKTFLDHPYATTADSVNPYLIIGFLGAVLCNPASDDWVDTSRSPALSVDITGDSDAWNHLANAVNDGLGTGYGTQWEDWQTVWTGVDVNVSEIRTGAGDQFITTTTTNTSSEVRRGTQTALGFATSQTSIGDKVIDVNLSQFMRQVEISVTAYHMRPNTGLHVFVDNTKLNAQFVPDAGFEPTSEGCARTDSSGFVKGTLTINAGQFRTGERTITLTDEPNNTELNSTTSAKYVFSASGLLQTKQDTIISTRQPYLTTKAVTDSRVVSNQAVQTVVIPAPPPPPPVERQTENSGGGGGDAGPDPLAQSFLVSSTAFPYGMMLDSVTLFFKRKPTATNLPVWVEIRPMVNGYPHASKILPFSVVSKLPSEVNIPTTTDHINSIRAAGTEFKFSAPVYLEAGSEYCVVAVSNDAEYEIYLSELGGRMLGTGEIVGQSSLGSLFKSQNGRTWTAFQELDMMLLLKRASFDTTVEASVVSKAKAGSSAAANLFHHNASILSFGVQTPVSHEFKIRNLSTGVVSPAWTPFSTDTDVRLDSEAVVNDADSLQIKTKMSTTVEAVAPLFDLSRNSVITVKNLVNNYGLLSDGIIIRDGGAGFSSAPTLTVSGGGATSNAILSPVMSGGALIGVLVVFAGEGYTSAPTITVTGGSPTSNAVVVYRGFETDNHGGNAMARYLTRRVTLRDDLDTDFIKVVMDVNRPTGTAVEVFIKAVAADDPTPLDERPWIKMQNSEGGLKYSGSDSQFIENVWVPDSNSLTYVSAGVTYPTVKTFAVKVVMLSSNTSVVPRCRDLRVTTAMPL